MKNDSPKKPYVAPKVVEVGSVSALTLATGSMNNLDADFPDGTPFDQLTFS